LADVTNEVLTDEERERMREMSRQMADIEFQMDIAPNLNYRGPIDPKLARLRTTPDDFPTNVRGYRIPSAEEYAKEAFISPEEAQLVIESIPLRTNYVGMGASQPLPVEAGAVSVVNARNARPEIWAHEYRHAQGLGKGAENLNRKIDAWNAQNKQQWDDAVEMEQYRLGDKGKKAPKDETEQRLIKSLMEMRVADQYSDMLVPNPWFKRRG